MPTYQYERISTGETFTEFLPISRRDEPCQDPDVRLAIMSPRVMATDFLGTVKKGDSFRQAVIEPKIKGMNPLGRKNQ